MGYNLYREVKRAAPDVLTHREKLAAMVLADDANDKTRLTYGSTVDPELMQHAMVKTEREMRRILARLQEVKIVEHAGGGHNGRTAKYRFLHLDPDGCPGSPCRCPLALGGEKEPPTDADDTSGVDSVGGLETPAYDEPETGPAGEKSPPTEGVGGRFPPRRRAKKAPPTPTTSSTTSFKDSSAPPAADDGDDGLFASPAAAPATPTKPSAAENLAAFENFYKPYPKHKARAQALRAWEAAIARGVPPEHIAAASERYAAERKGRDAKYTKYPATWLNGECYDDEPDPEPTPGADGEWQPYRDPTDQSVYDESW